MLEPRPWPADAPQIKESKVTLVAEDGAGGLVWASAVGDKRRLLAGTTGPLYAFWHGKYANHLFHVERFQAAVEVGEGKDVRREVPDEQRRLIKWHAEEARRHGFVTVHPRFDAETVRAAGAIAKVADRATIKAMIQWGFGDDRWRDRLFTLRATWRQWDGLRVAWERADSPAYVEADA